MDAMMPFQVCDRAPPPVHFVDRTLDPQGVEPGRGIERVSCIVSRR
jgi:hypothetical protein